MSLDRRQLIAGAGLMGTALGDAIPAAAGSAARRTDWYKSKGRLVKFDVDLAVLGYTNATNDSGAISAAPTGSAGAGLDTRGIIQYCEGVLYPGGSIPELPAGKADDPGSPSSITWILPLPASSPQTNAQTDCVNNAGRPAHLNAPLGDAVPAVGTFTNQASIIINRPCRANPHFVSAHHYYLGGVVGNDNIAPQDLLVSSGTENGSPPGDDVLRAVTGGTGYFKFARGQVTQRRLGRNNSRIRGLGAPGAEPLSPNYRLTFELMLW